MKEQINSANINKDLEVLAKKDGLLLQPSSFRFNETGLDFQVVHAHGQEGQPWILRIPRRPDVLPRAHNEYKVLQFLHEKLPVAVPQWQIFEPDLIAYPQLAGKPAATIDMEQSQYIWNIDNENLTPEFISTLANAIAALHAIEPTAAAQAGLKVSSPEQVRETLYGNMNRVKQEIGVANALWEQWQTWLQDDSYWPAHSCLVHGDLQAAHLLVDESSRVTGFLDWTEAEVSDPSIDFAVFLTIFGEKSLQQLLEHYEMAGGKTWPRMVEHLQQRQAAYGVNIGLFVLESDNKDYLAMARTVLGLSEA